MSIAAHPSSPATSAAESSALATTSRTQTLPHSLVEAAALGDVATVSAWTGNINLTVQHPSLPAGCTLLMAACSTGQTEVVRHLLARGASHSAHAAGGVTALLFATTAGATATVELLLTAGASLEATTLEKADHIRVDGRRTATKSHTALEIAEARGDTATALVIREHAERRRRSAEAAAAALLAEEEKVGTKSREKREKDRRRREEKRERLRRVRQQEQEQRTAPPPAQEPSAAGPAEASPRSPASSQAELEVVTLSEVPPAVVAAARRRGAVLSLSLIHI